MLAEDALPAVFGPYLLLKSLGRGGMGTVYLAQPINPIPDVPEKLVVKLLHPHLGTEELIRRFRHEVEVATRIDSPHVAKVYALGQFGPTVYLAMEYIDGVPLSVLIQKWREKGSLPALGTAVSIVRDAVVGLRALHEATDANGNKIGFVHRDIAPKNIMVGSDGLVRIIDLGIGRSELKGWETAAGAVMGTPGFMAPEQIEGKADVKSDVFSMGAVLFETLTLAPMVSEGALFEMLLASSKAENLLPSAVRPDVPPDLDALVYGAVRAAPEHRYTDSGELLARLDAALSRLGRTADLGLVVNDAVGAFVSDAATLIAPSRDEDYLFPPSKISEPPPWPSASSQVDVGVVTDRDLPNLVDGEEPTLQRDRTAEIDEEIARFRQERQRPEPVDVDRRPVDEVSKSPRADLDGRPAIRPTTSEVRALPAEVPPMVAPTPSPKPRAKNVDLLVLVALLLVVLGALALLRAPATVVESLPAADTGAP